MADWIEVAFEADLADRRPVRVTLGDESVFLIKAGKDWFAIGNQCTHQGAALDKGVIRLSGSLHTVTCPAHGSMFRLDDGKAMRPPATKPVRGYNVRVIEGRVLLRPRVSTVASLPP
ncbi:MAG TPA: Rieske 2Fe-2S domain-containing protein [Actinomycetota bacterium]|nr:Rieske 2Fe-2S domain-containing protein [Actinomycetota bacterium]